MARRPTTGQPGMHSKVHVASRPTTSPRGARHRRTTDITQTRASGGSAERTTVRRLCRRERAIWAVGSPSRAITELIVSALMMWLGYTSIGFSAVFAVAVLLAVSWGIPFAWASRLRLMIDSTGVTDIRRFRRFHHDWDGGWLAWDRRGGEYGLVLCRPHHGPPLPLLASWCIDRDSAIALLRQLDVRGWPVRITDEPASQVEPTHSR